MKKISAAILDFAKPLTDGMATDVPLDVRRGTIGLAITIWNAVVLQACGQGEVLADLFDRFRKLPPRESARMAPIVRDLVLRRHALYAKDLRLVGEWELRDRGGGELSLKAVALAPPEEKPS